MGRIAQEFYCGECQGYFLIQLNMALNMEVHIVCPNCGHEHRRCIKDGQIYENGRYESKVKEEILCTRASYSKEPLTAKMKSPSCHRRDGVPLLDEDMKQRWLQVAARERGED